MSQTKVLKDIDELIDLFLSSDFDPLPKAESAVNLNKFQFEAEIGDDEEESTPPSSRNDQQQLKQPHLVPGAKEQGHFKHDEYFLKKCGRVLAKMGDELNGKRTNVQRFTITEELRRIVQPLETKSNDTELVAASWESFKHILDSYISTEGGDAPNVLGAILLTVSGLSQLGSGAKSFVRLFTKKFITRRALDGDIERIGGLDGLMRTQLD